LGGKAGQIHAEVDEFAADVQMAPGALGRFADRGIRLGRAGVDGVQGWAPCCGFERNKNTNGLMWASGLFRLLDVSRSLRWLPSAGVCDRFALWWREALR
jgi:hypothetical protein